MADPVPVLPAGYLRTTAPLTLCPCQWGPSGHCDAGRHHRCARTRGAHVRREDRRYPETHIAARDGAALAPVWRVGRPCHWECPCPCHTQVAALIPPPPVQPPRQGVTGGNRSCGPAPDHGQLTIWEETADAH